MARTVKDVFFNCVSNVDKFKDAKVDEIKFSKKLNSVILITSSNDNISLLELERFEKEAKSSYDLNSFKIEYKYLGKKENLTKEDVLEILDDVKEKYDYTKHVFNNSDINITDNLEILLNLPYANFLKIKKIDEYIALDIKVKYGIEIKVVINEKSGVITDTSNDVKFVKVERKEVVNSTPVPNNVGDEKKAFVPRKPLTEEEKLDRKLAKEPQPDNVIFGVDIRDKNIKKIKDLVPSEDRICIEGEIFKREDRELKSGKTLICLDVTDKTSKICCKMFLDKKKLDDLKSKKALNKGDYILLQGKASIDSFSNELSIMIHNIVKAEKGEVITREDNAKEKRVELHMHTQMSAMDGVSSASDIINQAIKWGHKAVAITDHGVVQSFPDAIHLMTGKFSKLVKKEKGYPTTQEIIDAAPIKILYGVEGYLVQDIEPNAKRPDSFCVFDIETTGLNKKYEKITEIAVCKVKDGKIIDEFTTFVNPEKHIPEEVQNLTHITDELVKDAPTIEEVLPQFIEFTKDSVLVAHNSSFDVGFISYFANEQKLDFHPYVIDTLTIAREI